MKATPIIEPLRKITPKGNIVYIAIWSVRKSKYYQDGIKYSLALISKGVRVIGYDYNPTEGHHKHYIQRGHLIREKYKFKGLEDIFMRFYKDVDKFEGRK